MITIMIMIVICQEYGEQKENSELLRSCIKHHKVSHIQNSREEQVLHEKTFKHHGDFPEAKKRYNFQDPNDAHAGRSL